MSPQYLILCFFLDKIKFFIPFPYFYLLINPFKDPYPLQHQSLQPSSSWRRQLTWPWVWRFCSLWTQSGVWLFYLQTWIKINALCADSSLERGGSTSLHNPPSHLWKWKVVLRSTKVPELIIWSKASWMRRATIMVLEGVNKFKIYLWYVDFEKWFPAV